jgi:hypothetical protein
VVPLARPQMVQASAPAVEQVPSWLPAVAAEKAVAV